MPFDTVWFWVFAVLGAIVALLAIVHFLRQQACKKIFFEKRPEMVALFEKEFRDSESLSPADKELSQYLAGELERLNTLTPKSNVDWEYAHADLYLLALEINLLISLKKMSEDAPRATQI